MYIKHELTLCRSYLKPYCMGRKTAFFFQRAFNLHTKTSTLERLGQYGTFKSQALLSVRDGKGLNISSVTDNIRHNNDNWREQEGKQAPSSVMSSPLQHLVHSGL
jgi:hypothetical protein